MLRRVAIVVVVSQLWACVQSRAVTCASGLTCPANSTCDDVRRRCVDPAQLAACSGLGEDEVCTLRELPGVCIGGACEPTFCGDGRRTGIESCDGAALDGQTCASLAFYGETTGLACRPDCTFDTTGCVGSCGDAIRNGNELCDGTDIGAATCRIAGYYKDEGLACSPFCTYDVSACSERCGDGIRNGPELCDGARPLESCADVGLDAGILGCSLSCGYALTECARFGWRLEQVFANTRFSAIHGSSATDVWAVGESGVARHHDGSTWTTHDVVANPPNFTDVWAIAPGDAWAIANAAVWRWDGTTWTRDTSGPNNAVTLFALAANDVWVGTTTGLRRWNGNAWSDGGLTTYVRAIHGVSTDDVWAVLLAGTVRHWNGTQWEVRDLPSTNMYAIYLRAVGQDEAWIAGGSDQAGPLRAHWSGGSWTTETSALASGSEYALLIGTAANDLWLVDEDSLAEHYDGHSWQPVQYPVTRLCAAVDAGNMVCAVSNGAIQRYTGQAWIVTPPPPAIIGGALFSSVSGHRFMPSSATGEVAHHDGFTWTVQTASSGALRAVWGTSHDNVWVVGVTGKPARYNGTTWQEATVANTVELRSVWGTSDSDVWAGGVGGVMLHYNGTTWTNRNISGVPGGNFISQISGSGPNDVWAMTSNGAVFRWTGTWAPVTLPNAAPAARALVVVGPDAPIVTLSNSLAAWHRENGAWVERGMPTATFPPFRLVASSSVDVIALGQGGDIHHFDGEAWSPVRRPDDVLTNIAFEAVVYAKRIDFVFVSGSARVIRSLLRTQPWRCASSEVGACADAVDNDCDGHIDARDSQCP